MTPMAFTVADRTMNQAEGIQNDCTVYNLRRGCRIAGKWLVRVIGCRLWVYACHARVVAVINNNLQDNNIHAENGNLP